MNTIVNNAIIAALANLEVTSSVSKSPFGYGTDMWCESDLDPRMKEVAESALVLAQSCVRRIDTPNGLPDDNEWGISVSEYLNRPTTRKELYLLESEISAELVNDDRIDNVKVSVETSTDFSTLTIEIRVTPKDAIENDFTLILSASDVGVIIEEMRS